MPSGQKSYLGSPGSIRGRREPLNTELFAIVSTFAIIFIFWKRLPMGSQMILNNGLQNKVSTLLPQEIDANKIVLGRGTMFREGVLHGAPGLLHA